jgi:Tfp pilus assembly protein PilX
MKASLHISRALSRQSGVTLVVTMVMLVLLTLFVLAGIRLANVNLRITGNFQWQKQTELMTDSVLEQLISSSVTFDDPNVQAGTAAEKDICTDGTVATAGNCALTNPAIGKVRVPRCTHNGPAKNYTIKDGELTPDDNNWVVSAYVTDPVSGAKTTIYRGVTVRMLAQHCPL